MAKYYDAADKLDLILQTRADEAELGLDTIDKIRENENPSLLDWLNFHLCCELLAEQNEKLRTLQAIYENSGGREKYPAKNPM